jgi:hypothetical protein
LCFGDTMVDSQKALASLGEMSASA